MTSEQAERVRGAWMTFLYIPDEFPALYIDSGALDSVSFAVHTLAMLRCVAMHNDGIMNSTTLQLVTRQLGVRGRDKVVKRLVDSGLWEDLGDGTYHLDWTHQKPADQVIREKDQAAKRNADYRERNSRCNADDHSMCVGTQRKCQSKRVTKPSQPTPHSTPLQSIPFQSNPAKDKDLDMDMDWSGDDANNLDTLSSPPTDQTRLAFGHHPDTLAPSGAPGPEDAHWSAPAVVQDGVDAEGPVMPADSRSDEVSEAGGTPVPEWPKMTDREAVVRAITELDITESKSGVTLRLSKEAWAIRKKYEPSDYPQWLHSARDVASVIADFAEKRLGAKTTTPASEIWPMEIKHAEMSLAWIGGLMSEIIEESTKEAQAWRDAENP